MTRFASYALAAICVLLGGCPETETCPPGTAAPVGPDGEVTGECVPIDSGADAADTGGDTTTPDAADDSTVDAGPCGMECTGATPLCDEGSGMCVACLMDSDCADATAAKCGDDGTCTACDMSAQCGGITGTEVCATSGDRMGECVECFDAEVDACGGNACNPLSNACSAFGTAVQDPCAPCDTDTNCSEPEHYCVPMEFPVGTARDGGFCLKATPGCSRPFGVVISGRDSLSGVTGQSYCGVNEALTTCDAVNALLDDTTCPGGMDSECPEGGTCQTLDPTGAAFMNRCTYRCDDILQCKTGPAPGSTCGDGSAGGDDYCGG